MDQNSMQLVRKAFLAFYSNWTPEQTNRIDEREFGYIPFGGPSMIRHLSYRSLEEIELGIRKTVPLSAYMSNVLYERPAAPMDEKGWKGALLDFDIDADHIKSPCTAEHDNTVCKACYTIVNPLKRKCPNCGKAELMKLKFFCKTCLGAAKEHTKRAIDMLTLDFGVAPEAISVYFSGNRGYHIHVEDERFLTLGTEARSEITDYMLGNGLALNVKTFKGGYGAGWYRRLASDVNTSSRKTGAIIPPREAVAKKNAEVDPSVTNDIHRILRMPKTLHGSSGMMKARVLDLDSFNPLTDAVVLGDDPVMVDVKIAPKLEFKGKSYGPYSSQHVELPLHVAVYLILKDVATSSTE
jgi:DNA primase small subunit